MYEGICSVHGSVDQLVEKSNVFYIVYTCRQLANHRDVGWQEYWEILGCYCDLHKSDGLEKLEHYLASLTTPPRPHQSVVLWYLKCDHTIY